MYKKIFIDANIILDIFDSSRTAHQKSLNTYQHILSHQIELFTSCDIITTLYYIEAKKDRKEALLKIQNINKTIKVIEFSNNEVASTCTLMIKDSDYNDLEDTIQYILAKKHECDLIISNDKKFTSKEIELLSSELFCERVGI